MARAACHRGGRGAVPESGQRRRFASASWAAAGTPPLLLQLWIPPAFGCRPEYDNGLEEIVFGFEPWIIVVNLAMPFSIFYRMHAAASLFEVYGTI